MYEKDTKQKQNQNKPMETTNTLPDQHRHQHGKFPPVDYMIENYD